MYENINSERNVMKSEMYDVQSMPISGETIDYVLNEQQTIIEGLITSVEMLERRLSPILLPEEDQNKPSDPRSTTGPKSAMSATISNNNYALDSIGRKLTELRQRVNFD